MVRHTRLVWHLLVDQRTCSRRIRSRRHSRPMRWLLWDSSLVAPWVAIHLWAAYNARVPNFPEPPAPSLPSPNGYQSYVAALRQFKPITHALENDLVAVERGERPHTFRQSQLPHLLAVSLRANQPAFATLRGGFDFSYYQPAQRSYRDAGEREYWSRCQALARLLLWESHALAQRGDGRGATRDALDVLQMGYDIPRDGAFPAPMVGWALRRLGQGQLWRLLPHLDAGTCQMAVKRLERLRSREVNWAESLQEEKWTRQAGMLEIMRTEGWAHSFFAEEEPRVAYWRSLRINNHVVLSNLTRLYDLQIAQAKRPYPLQTPVPTPAPMFSDPINTVYAPVIMERSPITNLAIEANDALLLSSLALRAYHLEWGHYPPNLSALVPRYLKEVPHDPFDRRTALYYSAQSWKFHRSDLPPAPILSTVTVPLYPAPSPGSVPPVPTGVTPTTFDIQRAGPPAPDLMHFPYHLYNIGPDARGNGGQPLGDKTQKAGSSWRWRTNWDSKGDVVAGLND